MSHRFAENVLSKYVEILVLTDCHNQCRFAFFNKRQWFLLSLMRVDLVSAYLMNAWLYSRMVHSERNHLMSHLLPAILPNSRATLHWLFRQQIESEHKMAAVLRMGVCVCSWSSRPVSWRWCGTRTWCFWRRTSSCSTGWRPWTGQSPLHPPTLPKAHRLYARARIILC